MIFIFLTHYKICANEFIRFIPGEKEAPILDNKTNFLSHLEFLNAYICTLYIAPSLKVTQNKPRSMYSKVLFFDSDCIMCNSFIQWVHHHDPKDQIRFSHFHSSLAEKLQLSIDDHTMIYYADGTKYNRSQAFIEIMKELQVPSFFIWILRSVPRPIRDTIYRFIAHNRYRLGKKDPSHSCSLEIQAKIIE